MSSNRVSSNRSIIDFRSIRMSGCALVIVSTLAALLLSEIALRFFIRLSDNGYCRIENPRLIFGLSPNSTIPNHHAKISSQGLNDKYYSLKKPPGKIRIAVVSDSQAFGWKVGPQRSFPKILERKLNQAFGEKYEVMNFSVPGYNTMQERELIEEKVIHFEPDAVVLVFTWNDLRMPALFHPEITPLNYLHHKSEVVHLFFRLADNFLWLLTPKAEKYPEW